MTPYYFLSAILIIFTLLTPSDKIFTFSDTNARITDKLIHDICSETRNPSLCLNNLNSLRGARLFPKPLVVLATSPINMAHSRANKTATMIWDHYRGLPTAKFQLRNRYKKCVHKYADAMKQLNKTKKFLSEGDLGFVQKYTRMAVDRVDSCDVELIEPPWTKLEANKKFLQANGEFKDLCDIVLEICNKLSTLNWLI